MSITSQIHKIFTFVPKIARATLMFLTWVCVHVTFLRLSNSYIWWNVESIHFRHTYFNVKDPLHVLKESKATYARIMAHFDFDSTKFLNTFIFCIIYHNRPTCILSSPLGIFHPMNFATLMFLIWVCVHVNFLQ